MLFLLLFVICAGYAVFVAKFLYLKDHQRSWVLFASFVLVGLTAWWRGPALSPYSDSQEVAWTGVRSTSAESLCVGQGVDPAAIVAWPKNHGRPQVCFGRQGADSTKATLNVRAAGGFVKTPTGLLGGHLLGTVELPGAFQATRKGNYLEISGPSTKLSIPLLNRGIVPRRRGLVGRVDRVSNLWGETVANHIRALRSEGAKREGLLRPEQNARLIAASQLEAIADDTLLIRDDADQLWLTHPDLVLTKNESEGEIALSPTTEEDRQITLSWLSESLKVQVHAPAAEGEGNREGVELRFLKPWRTAFPLPDQCRVRVPKVDAVLAPIDGVPPGTAVGVELPLNSALSPTPLALACQGSELGYDGTPSIAPPERNIYASPPGLDWTRLRGAQSVGVRISTVRDVLPGGWLISFYLLCAAAIVRLWHTTLIASRASDRRDRELSEQDLRPLARLGAVVLVTLWALLTVRLSLAIRFAIEPSHLDGFAMGALRQSLFLMAALPCAFIFAFALAARLGGGAVRAPSPNRLVEMATSRWMAWVGVLVVAVIGWIFLPGRMFRDVAATSISRFEAIEWVLVAAYGLTLRGSVARALASRINDLLRLMRSSSLVWLAERLRKTSTAVRILCTVALFVAAIAVVAFQFQIAVMAAIVGLVTSRREDSWWLLPLGMLLVVGMALKDVGQMVPILLLLAVLTIVFALPNQRRWRLVIPALAIFVSTTIGGLVFLELLERGQVPSILQEFGERGLARFYAKKLGQDAQALLPLARAWPGAAGGLAQDALEGAIEHTWENERMSHIGGWLGLGWGRAPVRSSQVPQHTIQTDSTFSFFVSAEHGWIGGAAFLLIYAVPAWLLLVTPPLNPLRFGTFIVLLFPFGEALTHALMNLHVLPFTGRPLPLLSPNSPTDAALWLAVFCGAIVLMGSEEKVEADGPSVVAASDHQPRWKEGNLTRLALMGAIPIAGVLASLAFLSGANPPAIFDWTRLLQKVSDLARTGELNYVTRENDPSNTHLGSEGCGFLVRFKLGGNAPYATGATFVEQDIARHNGDVLQCLCGTNRAPPSILPPGAICAGTAAFDPRTLTTVRSNADLTSLILAPMSMVLGATKRANVVAAEGAGGIAGNPEFNLRVSFGEAAVSRSIVASDGTVIAAPTMVNGRRQTRVDRTAAPPWFAAAAAQLGATESSPTERSRLVSINSPLQRRAQGWADRLGPENYNDALTSSTNADWDQHLPPRLGLVVLSLPQGEVLAQAGWPRTSGARAWHVAQDGSLLPPTNWAPMPLAKALQRRYWGDRNFDLIEMGSATKPLWALSALSRFPALANLRVVPQKPDTELFGMSITTPEKNFGNHSSKEPFTLRRYLAQSDNSYQVRLGALLFADRDGEGPQAGAQSSSTRERFGDRPWLHVPVFEKAQGRPVIDLAVGRARGLSGTQGATEMSNFFRFRLHAEGRNRPTPFSSHAWSFWTGQAGDDRWRADPGGGLPPFAPQVTTFTDWDQEVAIRENFVSHLLGGAGNRWSNTTFAAAFGAVVTGRPIVAHVANMSSEAQSAEEARDLHESARLVRPGLEDVLLAQWGTGKKQWSRVVPLMRELGLRAYGKTGTLEPIKGVGSTARFTVALVQWGDEPRGTVDRGLVFSVFVERAGGTDEDERKAKNWLVGFLNEEDTKAFLRTYFGRLTRGPSPTEAIVDPSR